MATKAKDTKAKNQAKGSEIKNAVIMTGGKQYLVKVGDLLKIEKIVGEHKEGDKIVFDNVLMITDDKDFALGTPKLDGMKVTGTIKKIGRDPKVVVIHYKPKSRYFKKAGHRQPFFQVEIDKIN